MRSGLIIAQTDISPTGADSGLSDAQLSLLIQQVQADNPSIINPGLIKPDQLIRLKIPQQYCPASHAKTGGILLSDSSLSIL